MIDPISAAIVLGAVASGWLIGRYGRLKAHPKQPLPICLCQHHYGTHDPTSGGCTAEFKERFQQSAGGYQKDVWRSCSCVRYTGPQPVESYWVPPAADMSIVTAPRETDR